jgi:hypothetical protein
MESKNVDSRDVPAAPQANSLTGCNMVRMTTSEDISITCYENEVPPFIEAELEQLYASLFSSLTRFRIYGGAENASTYIVREGAAIKSVWLFCRAKRKVRVINEGISIHADEVSRFTNYIFTVYGSVNVITFHAVETSMQQLPFPHQRFDQLEDIVLTLPHTVEEYMASLGKSTRSYLYRYLNRLHRHFPSCRHRIYTKHEIEAKHIHDIIQLNRLRMTDKGKTSAIDDEEMHRIIRLAREYGLVSVITIDDRICAGTINYTVGRNSFLEVVAHDPEYNDYRLGTLCCYLTICECIARGSAEYHFLWGNHDYKYRLRGVRRNLSDLAVYRSRLHFLLQSRTALLIAVNGYIHGTKLWLLDKAKQRNSPISRIVFHSLNFLRSVKQLTVG